LDVLEQRGSKAYFWGPELNLWSKKQKENPYIVGGQFRTLKEFEVVATTDLVFGFSGKRSTLTYKTDPSGHSRYPHTMGVTLKVPEEEAKILTDDQCSASLMGKYLFLYRYWGKGKELIDLETGKSVLGRLQLGKWMY
jgi:hypothetical protein